MKDYTPQVKRIVNPDSRLNMLSQPGNPLQKLLELSRDFENYKVDQQYLEGTKVIPSVPQSVTATAQKNNVVRISWLASQEEGIDHYNIYRATDGNGTGATLIGHKSQSAGATIYFDWANDLSGTVYYFAVEAISTQTITSGYSDWVTPGTKGKMLAGADNVVIDENGINIAVDTITSPLDPPSASAGNTQSLKFLSGTNIVGQLFTYIYGPPGGPFNKPVTAVEARDVLSSGAAYVVLRTFNSLDVLLGEFRLYNASALLTVPLAMNAQQITNLADPTASGGATTRDQIRFGDGSDGDVTIAADTNLSRDMQYHNLTVNAVKTLYTKGFRIKVSGTLTIAATGAIDCSGSVGGTPSGATGGTAGAAAYTSSPHFGIPGAGGAGGNGGGAGTVAGGDVAAAAKIAVGPLHFQSGCGGGGGAGYGAAPTAGSAGVVSLCGASGGGLGHAGGSGSQNIGGGGGGGGGGVIEIAANTINNAGAINAKGGNGGPGQNAGSAYSGDGSGGGGGSVTVYYRSTTGSGVGTLSAAGGSKGTGGANTSQNGSAGVTASYQI